MMIQTKTSINNVALILGLFYLFYFAMVGVYVIYMPKVLKDIGYSDIEVGAIYTSAPLMRFILPFIFKKWIKLTNRVYLISLVLTLIITLIFFLTIHNFYIYLLLNLLYGGAMGVALPFVEVIAIEQIGKKNYGKVRLWGSIGFILIALILGKILNSPTLALIFLSLTAFFTMLIGFILVKYDKKSKQKDENIDYSSFSLKKYWAFWASIFLFQFSFGGFYNFFTIYETQHHIPLDIVSYLWTFGVICEIFMLIFQTSIIQKYSLFNLILITSISAIFRWLILAYYPNNLPLVLLSQATHALNFALYYTATIAYVYQLYSQKRLAQQFYLGIGFGLGGAFGAIVSGVVYNYSPKALFIFEAMMALISVIFLLIHKKRKEYVS